jgi:Flp pilus assembly protein TadD
MKKIFLSICASLFLSANLFAENMNELPMYGGQKKTPAQELADQEFIKVATKDGMTREVAAAYMADRGWEAVYKNDISSAMKKFNQAWLLNPNNAKAFWGFGVVAGRKGDLPESKKYLEKASQLDPKNSNIMSDLAFSLAQLEETKRAEELFAAATKLDPKNENAFFLWAVLKFHSNDYKGAWEKVKEAKKLGGKTIDPNFIKDLSAKLPEK